MKSLIFLSQGLIRFCLFLEDIFYVFFLQYITANLQSVEYAVTPHLAILEFFLRVHARVTYTRDDACKIVGCNFKRYTPFNKMPCNIF